MLVAAEFSHFRGFKRLTAELHPHAYIVGPNSAGKSTVLEAIALAERCLQKARRLHPHLDVRHCNEPWRGYSLPAVDDEDGADPVRFEFGLEEATAVVRWTTGASLHMTWPEQTEDREPGHFYLVGPDGLKLRQPDVESMFSTTCVVPVVTPLERVEELKDVKYVRGKSWSRLASRHFRNHAFLMQRDDEWERFKTFAHVWLPEIQLLDVAFDPGENRLGVYYGEPGSRIPKELAWAGDGIQIWVQLLWHLFRVGDSETIVLDEPEVYLHPDLQRRLVRLLDSTSAQIIIASHSADVIAEAPPDGLLWIDRRLGQARRAKSPSVLSALSASLGSSYNLHLARAMRAQLVIATDCQDLRVLRLLAKQVGALKVADEQQVSTVQLQDVNSWSGTEKMGEMLREALPPGLPAVILLQGGQRTRDADKALMAHLAATCNTVRIWSHAELENFLLDPETVARASGAAPEAAADRMQDIVNLLYEPTRSAFGSNAVRAAGDRGSQAALLEAETAFDQLWISPANRLSLVRGTEVLRGLNAWIERDGYRLLTGHRLAKATRPHSVPSEVFSVLLDIDGRVL